MNDYSKNVHFKFNALEEHANFQKCIYFGSSWEECCKKHSTDTSPTTAKNTHLCQLLVLRNWNVQYIWCKGELGFYGEMTAVKMLMLNTLKALESNANFQTATILKALEKNAAKNLKHPALLSVLNVLRHRFGSLLCVWNFLKMQIFKMQLFWKLLRRMLQNTFNWHQPVNCQECSPLSADKYWNFGMSNIWSRRKLAFYCPNEWLQ